MLVFRVCGQIFNWNTDFFWSKFEYEIANDNEIWITRRWLFRLFTLCTNMCNNKFLNSLNSPFLIDLIYLRRFNVLLDFYFPANCMLYFMLFNSSHIVSINSSCFFRYRSAFLQCLLCPIRRLPMEKWWMWQLATSLFVGMFQSLGRNQNFSSHQSKLKNFICYFADHLFALLT